MTFSAKADKSDLVTVSKGAGLALGGNIVGKAILFLYTMILAWILGSTELGIYFLGIAIVRLLVLFSVLGLDVGVLRHVSIYQTEKETGKIKGTVVISSVLSFSLGVLLAGLTWMLAESIAALFFNKPELGIILKILAVSIPFEAAMRIFLASTRGLKIIKYVVYTEYIGLVTLRLVFALFFVFVLELGLKGVAFAYVAAAISTAFMAFGFSNILIPLTDKKIEIFISAKELFRFSLPMVFTMLLYDLMSHVDIFMLGHFMESSDVGIYNVSLRFIALTQIVFMAFQPIFQPIVAELHAKKKIEQLSELLKIITHWSVIIGLPSILVLLILPDFFLSFFGNDFSTGSTCLVILVLAFFVSAFSNLPASVIFMSGRSDLALLNNFIVLFINVTFNYVLIPKYGIVGAAIATGIAFVILAVIRICEIYLLMSIHPFSLKLWKPTFASFVSLILVLTFSSMFNDDTLFVNLFFIFLTLLSYSFIIYILKFDENQMVIWDILKRKMKSLPSL